VPVTTVDDPGHLHVAWANDQTNTSCTAGGNIIVLTFEYDGCEDAHGCLSLNSLTLLDGDNVEDDATISGTTATILGGSGYCAGAQGGGGGNAPNAPPSVASLPDQEAAPGTTLSVMPAGSDADGGSLSWGGANLPTGAAVDQSTGTFTWTPTAAQEGGVYEGVSLIATDIQGASGGAAFSITVGTPAPTAYVPNRVLVMFSRDVVVPTPPATGGVMGALTYNPSSMQALLQTIGATRLDRLIPSFTHSSIHTISVQRDSIVLPNDMTDAFIVTLADTAVGAAIVALTADSASVRFAEPDYTRYMQFVPSDSLFGRQWWLHNTGQFSGTADEDIDATEAWDTARGASHAIRVGVIDTGIDYTHPELGAVEIGPNFSDSGIDSYDDAPVSHGTAVAGIIGARGANGLGQTSGVAGVNWGATLVAIKAVNSQGVASSSSIIQAVDWARTNGVPIINLSLGGCAYSSMENATFKNAFNAGMLVAVSMGNDNANIASYPAAYSKWVEAVGAVSNTGVRWDDANGSFPGCTWPQFIHKCNDPDYDGSNWGSWIDIAAPGGEEIATTRSRATGSYYPLNTQCWDYPDDDAFGGTSAAAPVVSGVASLVLSEQPGLSGEDIAEVLQRTAIDKTIYGVGWDDKTGWGVVNAKNAVDFVTAKALDRRTITSVTDYSSTSGIQLGIYSSPCISDYQYPVIRHEIRASVTFSQAFGATPDVWARKVGSIGWSTANPHVGSTDYDGWAEVVPGSVTNTGCTLRTYVYDVLSYLDGHHLAWCPTTPSQAQTAMTALGLAVTGVGNEAGIPRRAGLTVSSGPARRATTITFQVPRPQSVRLAVVDVMGRQVRLLKSGPSHAGTESLVWDGLGDNGRRAPAGLYLVHLTTPDGNATARLAVVQ
jgi:hypothetical protein